MAGKTTTIPIDEAAVRARYDAAGQSHVFDHFDELSSDDDDDDVRGAFLKQLDGIAVEKLAGYLAAARAADSKNDEHNDEVIEPFEGDRVGRTTTTDDDAGGAAASSAEASRTIGLEAIRNGEVAALVLAGGQGTRLGFSGPKGMYDIGLPSGRTLFRLLAERLVKLRAIAAAASSSSTDGATKATTARLPFYIMTSPINHSATVAYFAENDHFGLPASDVKFFAQGMLPCMTEEGKIILQTAGSVAMAPDGNGGIYPSLRNSGMIDDMIERGTKYLHVFSIDNALTKIADPVFVGHCVGTGADCGNKVVWKTGPHEKVGVLANKGGRPCIVEYSEITTEMAERTDPSTGRLVFGAGNICNHFYTMDFLTSKVLPNLDGMYHIARKKIPCYDAVSKTTVTPTEKTNGIKLESFIFDVFPWSEAMAVLDVVRDDEFAPVKNAPGSTSDSPDTARAYLSKQAERWVVAAGATLADSSDGDGGVCEIAPATSYAGEGLRDLVGGKTLERPFSL